ncbi:MAG: hypothetical protein GW795_13270 [Cyanobacteria bacterium]|nr:hypothetical protein [Cyanobacteria bacterium CG_2015-16_32_12]NCO76815.1 hypothetical protein [Cyanobacteria bacterium CG_2015-22_32_23]NCQ05060.1 hypothetical protein [Cyanobacteria bacterium CG_2015-09_32_10]NCQ42810.1 hypothetical protein [Cyanobacteria bacterium CG_2015-04_32_10]NCS85484.1 hypothetical protein [Cyanobacteria bacterium CG_2015-02_32_10]
MNINWQKLAQIKELEPYFTKDFQGFKNKIENYLNIWIKISPEDLDKLALIRALEVTNGCTQWAYRRGDQDCLPLEETQKCMKLSMSSIKNKEILLNNGKVIKYTGKLAQLMDESRSLYIDAFKNNIEGKEEEFYAISTAQFLVHGEERMNKCFQIIKDNYLSLFTDFFIKKGENYVKPYLSAYD